MITQSGKRVYQPAARSPYLEVKLTFMPARLRMASSSSDLTPFEIIKDWEMHNIHLTEWLDSA